MANYRQIHVSIWKDEWFLDLEPPKKLLFVYLFSNEATSLAGIYKLPLKVIAFETGLDQEFIKKSLAEFAKSGKVYYDNGIVWVVNMRRYHETKSDKVQTRIENDTELIPDCEIKRRYLASLIPYRYPIDTAPQLKEKEEEDKKEKEKEQENNSNSTAAVVFQLYESEIGSITKVIADKLNDAIDVYPGEWFRFAFEEAARNNKRNWAYVDAILKNWKANGFQNKNGKPGKRAVSAIDAERERLRQEEAAKNGNQ